MLTLRVQLVIAEEYLELAADQVRRQRELIARLGPEHPDCEHALGILAYLEASEALHRESRDRLLKSFSFNPPVEMSRS